MADLSRREFITTVAAVAAAVQLSSHSAKSDDVPPTDAKVQPVDLKWLEATPGAFSAAQFSLSAMQNLALVGDAVEVTGREKA